LSLVLERTCNAADPSIPQAAVTGALECGQRIGLLRQAGFDVIEATLSVEDFMGADEIFTSGNYSKIVGVNRLDEREFQQGPIARKALDLYMDWAHSKNGSEE